MRGCLHKREDELLLKDLKDQRRAGWTLRMDLQKGPAVRQNRDLLPSERRNAEILAAQLFMDGEARTDLQKRPRAWCECGRAEDKWTHWLHHCSLLKGVREKEWALVCKALGEWVNKLTEQVWPAGDFEFPSVAELRRRFEETP